MSIGVRSLSVLGEFKPFGLVAEAIDGKFVDDDGNKYSENYNYFLFDPEAARHRYDATDPALTDRRDHELFIRGNRIIWTSGARVLKRLTLPSPVVMAHWCRLGDMAEALLCILQFAALTIYSTSGEVTYIPLPRSITSIWALPFGLLFQQQTDVTSATHVPIPSTSPLFSMRETSRPRRQSGNSPMHNLNVPSVADNIVNREMSSMSSHLILKDPLEEPQLTYIEERGKYNIMKEFDETTIWTSDQIPLMASYNKGKMQHSVWVVEVINSNIQEANPNLLDVIPSGVILKQFSFRRIWQGKGAQTSTCKVFLATDEDAAPVICFLHQEQRQLLSLRLQSTEINNEILYDIKPDMSWSLPAIGAAPVIVTRPKAENGLLPYSDIIVLAPDSSLLLYSGKQCLCRYVLPSSLSSGRVSHNIEFRETSVSSDHKIIGVSDAIEERLNIKLNNGQMFRCALRSSPSSSLANDCITAIAEGLSSGFYRHVLSLLWKEGDSARLSESDNSGVNIEWDSFCRIIMQMCRPSMGTQKHLESKVGSSWEFLISSKFHKNFCKHNSFTGVSSVTSYDEREIKYSGLNLDASKKLKSSFYSELIMETLECLHAVYESMKLNSLRKRDSELLAVLLCDIAKYLGEQSYLDHYIRDFPDFSRNIQVSKTSISCKTPPSLFRWLENCLLNGCSSAKCNDLPHLICQNGSSVVSWARKIVSFYSLLSGAQQVGEKLSSGVCCIIADGSHCTTEELTVLAMVGERFGLRQLDILPSGVSLPLRHALDKCRESPPTDWPEAAYVLLGREDLALSHSARSCKSKEFETQTNVNLISLSTPYMLHLHPVTIPSAVSDTIGLDGMKFEDSDSVDGSMTDGMEHIFNSSTQLQYGRDLRLNEVRRLLCSARPVSVQTSVNPSASDQDVQQAQLWHLAQRTTSLPIGRGAFTLGTIYTLLTEAVAVPKLVLAGRLPAQQNATVNLDPNVRNIQELKVWPEFHNAVAAGLRLAPLQGKMSRTWIIYNKPAEPNAIHAGLLLALGLHGYLRVLNLTDIYQYYAQEHESTTVGLMLGLTASYRGTMDPSLSKSLFVHIPARHPSSFPELELPTLLQSAALMSVGLLYEGSAHPKTMQILLAEIGRRSGGDNVLEREGYAVSAGFSLGLVALGRGYEALGSMDAMVDRLFHYIGSKEVYNERYLSPALVLDDHNRTAAEIMDGINAVNVDVTAPGAIIALALMFLKTESHTIVSKLSIPQTSFDLQYVRPDFIMLRVIARNLIMWSRVRASLEWVQSQIPDTVKNGVGRLGDDTSDIDDMDAEVFVQAYVNIVAGACMSLGLRFAGTKDGHAQELLYDFALYFMNEIKLVSATSGAFPKGLSRYVDRGTLEMCLHLTVLSLSVVMAGSGHLQTFRLLRFLWSRSSAEGHVNYGLQMAVSLAIGFLFLGGGMRTFSTSNGSIAALLITLYPRLPTGPNDNRCHLQAFRHLYVLATEARWIQTIDVDTGLPVYAPLEVSIKETDNYAETSFCEVTPCLLPERAVLKTIRVCGPRYWPQVIEFVPEDKPWWALGDKNNPFTSGVLYIKRKVGACSYVDDPVGCQSLLSRAMHKVFGLTSLKASSPGTNGISEPGSVTVDQLVSTFSSDPSLIAFAQLCCNSSWTSRTDADFQEFCLQVLFECVSKDRPALLQVYLSLYTTIGSMADQFTSDTVLLGDSLFISNLKIAMAYNEALLRGRLTASRGGIVQSNFLGSIRKRVEDLLSSCQGLQKDFHNYLKSGAWPDSADKNSILLSWYLHWFGAPFPAAIKSAAQKIKPNINKSSSSFVPLLRLIFPSTDVAVIDEIDTFMTSNDKE